MNGSRKMEAKEIDEATTAKPSATLGLKRGFLSPARQVANTKSSSDQIGIGKPNLCSNLEKKNTEVDAGMTSSSNMEVSCNMALSSNPSLIPKNNGDGHKGQILQGSNSTHEEERDLETRREHEDQPVLEDGSVYGKKLGFHEEQARNPNEATKPSWSSILGRQTYGETIYSFKFMSDDDRKQVLEMGSLHIASQLFILRPWKLFVEAKFNDLNTIPVWVVMKRFPMELWDDEGFGRVASTIGKPLVIDKRTESMTRTFYACVCVEIDIK
ncbi:hypothetical protein FRX31_015911 [Thalictrum thalictroides]|uniref:Rna exonuclease n=1 Tax=Thalictrum thalictroides TaxID=46969 RepID=A0A7J6WEB5_THATH|nr:hypothetical protein FRX31_015911 [Thalictrum thalictroides]